jgi:hypothetical protein
VALVRPTFPGTQEVEIRKIEVQDQPWQKLVRPHLNKLDMVVHIYNSSYMGGISSRTAVLGWYRAKIIRPHLKNKQKGLVVLAEVLEHLPCKCRALSSNSSTSPTPQKKSHKKTQMPCSI